MGNGLRAGSKYAVPRRTPVGYRRVGTGQDARIEPDPAKADALRLAVALRATGRFSVRQISEAVAPYGLTAGRGLPLAPASMWRLLPKTAHP